MKGMITGRPETNPAENSCEDVLLDTILREGAQRTQSFDSISTGQMIKGLVGRGEWPGGTGSWGDYRTWLSPLNVPNLYNRSGFSIHGGDTPRSAGCIDLTGANNSFHNWLMDYGRPVVLDVSY